MSDLTIKDYIDNGFTLTFYLTNTNKYQGVLNGRQGRLYLTDYNLNDLKEFKNIFNLLKANNRLIKISGNENNYILQMLELQYEGPYNEYCYYLLKDIESSDSLDDLLNKYDDKKKGTNVKSI